MQLINETYVDAAALLSQTVKVTENNTNEQTGQVLDKVANYLDDLADFVNESQVIINGNVSQTSYTIDQPHAASIDRKSVVHQVQVDPLSITIQIFAGH